MTRLLSELRCGGCGARFWPEQSARAAWILCPRCGAAHAKPDASAADHRLATANQDEPARALLAWLARYWPGPRPLGAEPRSVTGVRVASV